MAQPTRQEVQEVLDEFGWLNVDAPDAKMQIVQACMNMGRLLQRMVQ